MEHSSQFHRHLLLLLLLSTATWTTGRVIWDCTPQATSGSDDRLDFGHCNERKYILERLMVAIVIGGVGLLCFVVSPFAICFSFCYRCFPCTFTRKKLCKCAYSARQVVYWTLFLVVGAGIAGGVLVWVGGVTAKSTYGDMYDALFDVPTWVDETAGNLDTCMSGVPGWDGDELDSVTNASRKFHRNVSDLKKTTDNIEPVMFYTTMFSAGFVVVLLLLVIARAASMHATSCGTVLPAIYLCVSGLLFFCCCMFLATMIGAEDLCPEFDKELRGEPGLLSGLRNQSCNESGLLKAQNKIDELRSELLQKACYEVWGQSPPLCDDQPYNSTANVLYNCTDLSDHCRSPPSPPDFQRLLSETILPKNDLPPDARQRLCSGEGNCTVEQCAQSCEEGTNVRNQSQEAWEATSKSVQARFCIERWFEEDHFNDCVYIFRKRLVEPERPTCYRFHSAAALLFSGTLILALSVLAASCVSCRVSAPDYGTLEDDALGMMHGTYSMKDYSYNYGTL
eukprot:Sspe_Gene.107625::Locus_85894_Transcript_2_2_Confidence_0.750_Length_1597::g.107625::m.107625